MSTETAQNKIYLSDYKAPDYQIEKVHLHFNLHESKTVVTCSQTIKKTNPSSTELFLNGENLKLISLKINEENYTNYELKEQNLFIKNTPSTFNLQIVTEINPEANKTCSGLYLSKRIFATQCEAEGFRSITYFMDRPDVMTSYSVTIEADKKKYPILLSNGDFLLTPYILRTPIS